MQSKFKNNKKFERIHFPDINGGTGASNDYQSIYSAGRNSIGVI